VNLLPRWREHENLASALQARGDIHTAISQLLQTGVSVEKVHDLMLVAVQG